MKKRADTPPPPDAAQVEALTQAVEALAHQIRHLSLILDEVREEVIYSVRNDLARADTWRPIAPPETTTVPEPVDEEESTSPPPAAVPPPRPCW